MLVFAGVVVWLWVFFQGCFVLFNWFDFLRAVLFGVDCVVGCFIIGFSFLLLLQIVGLVVFVCLVCFEVGICLIGCRWLFVNWWLVSWFACDFDLCWVFWFVLVFWVGFYVVWRFVMFCLC